MAEIDESENDEMRAHEVRRFAVKANQQGAEFVDPGKGSLTGEAQLVDSGVEQAFAPKLGALAGASVLDDVGNDMVVEADLAGGFGIKGGISTEVAASNLDTQAFDELEGRA